MAICFPWLALQLGRGLRRSDASFKGILRGSSKAWVGDGLSGGRRLQVKLGHFVGRAPLGCGLQKLAQSLEKKKKNRGETSSLWVFHRLTFLQTREQLFGNVCFILLLYLLKQALSPTMALPSPQLKKITTVIFQGCKPLTSLTLKTVFSHETPAPNDAPSYQVWTWNIQNRKTIPFFLLLSDFTLVVFQI